MFCHCVQIPGQPWFDRRDNGFEACQETLTEKLSAVVILMYLCPNRPGALLITSMNACCPKPQISLAAHPRRHAPNPQLATHPTLNSPRTPLSLARSSCAAYELASRCETSLSEALMLITTNQSTKNNATACLLSPQTPIQVPNN